MKASENKTTKGKKEMGRPSKYKGMANRLSEIEKLAMHGLTDKQLSDILGVAESTLNKYKLEHPDFSESIKRGKLKADLEIEKSLWHRAKGYEHEDTYFANYQGVILTQTYTKHYPPDTAAAFIWLKNRKPEVWRDKQEIEFTKPLEVIVSDYRGSAQNAKE